MRIHHLGVQKRAKLEKGCVLGHIDKFWKGHDGQIKKNAFKDTYLGSIFIPEKYVIRVLFVCPWTSLIPPLVIRVAPRDTSLFLAENTELIKCRVGFVDMYEIYCCQISSHF